MAKVWYEGRTDAAGRAIRAKKLGADIKSWVRDIENELDMIAQITDSVADRLEQIADELGKCGVHPSIVEHLHALADDLTRVKRDDRPKA